MRIISLAVMLSVLLFSPQIFAANSTSIEREKLNAERGDLEAQVSLAIMYFNNKNYVEAVKWFTKAAEKGNPTAQYNLGNMYIEGVGGLPKDYAEALKLYTKSAEKGYGYAQHNLGIAYKNGQGVTQDYAQAIKWFTKAADQNIAVAQNSLGVIYAKGEGGTPQDYAKAIEWYRKAAENNDAKGQFNLGSMYANGQGTKKDVVQAYFWLSLAAMQGKSYATERLTDLMEVMTPQQITEGKDLVTNHNKPKASK